MKWDALAQDVLDGNPIDKNSAISVLQSGDDELLAVLQAAFRVRRHYHGRKVTLQILQNAKSGVCSEDCAFCSQAARYRTGVNQAQIGSSESLVEAGFEAKRLGALTYCMVTSSRSPTNREIETICQSAATLKKTHPDLHLCTSLGMLSFNQAVSLKSAGVDRYNHNLETSRRFFPQVVTTHSYEDRLTTLKNAKEAGLELCCGGILGLGEEIEDRVELAFTVRGLGAHAVPVNFLDPRPGTPMQNRSMLTPAECLRSLAMFRLVHPRCELRLAGGRERCLKSMQPLALYAVDSIFTNGYLTTSGQGLQTDLDMIKDAGFVPNIQNTPPGDQPSKESRHE